MEGLECVANEDHDGRNGAGCLHDGSGFSAVSLVLSL